MTFKLPSSLYGIDGKEAYEKIINQKEKPEAEIPIASSILSNANIVKSDYIQIPNQNFVMAIAETDFNLNYEEAHKAVLKKGLSIPEINQFMAFHNYIIDCYQNKKQIFDAGGNPISDKNKEDLYKQLTKKCWTWLNEKLFFNKNTIEKIIGLDSKDNLLTKEEPLENYLMEDCYIDFTKLTKQGLASINSRYSKQNYVEGKNISFYRPGDDSVARFLALSVSATLNCNGGPSFWDSNLGVRAVAQGRK